MHHSNATEPAVLDPEGGGFVRLRLDLSYEGTDFAGWAQQPKLRTVQGELEKALVMVLRTRERVPTVCAGRTDAGVHARHQVAQADVPKDVWIRNKEDRLTVLRRLAGALPGDVRVHRITLAPDGFDARFSPLWRRYVYRVCDHQGGPDPLRRREILWHPLTLDFNALNAAAAVLVGHRDFGAFCRRRDGATTVRSLELFRWELVNERLMEATLVADAFCHSMVRSVVGASFAVAEGRRDLAWLRAVLASKQRPDDVQVVGAEGLTLEEVRYPPDGELCARAELTRNRRLLSP